jgi:hypothetical protein
MFQPFWTVQVRQDQVSNLIDSSQALAGHFKPTRHDSSSLNHAQPYTTLLKSNPRDIIQALLDHVSNRLDPTQALLDHVSIQHDSIQDLLDI